MSSGVLRDLTGAAGKKEEYEGRVRMKAAIVESESEEDRYQQQQTKLRSSLGQVTSRGMSLVKPHLPPSASKKHTLAVQPVDDEEDTELEEDDEEVEAGPQQEQRRGEVAADANGGGTRREKKASDEGWESFDNDWAD